MQRRVLVLGSLLCLATVLTFLDLQWLRTYRYSIASPDFFVYYLAAKVGSTHGWPAMYDPNVFLKAELPVLPRPLPYLNPPELAWLILPLSSLRYPLAAWIWKGLLVGAGAITWYFAAPGRGVTRFLHGLGAAILLPLFISLFFGQVSLVIIALIAIAWWLLRQDQPWLAGVVLALLFLKPQLAFLVPLALLIGGYWRVFLAWTLTTLVLAGAALVALGPSVLPHVQQALAVARAVPGPVQMSLERQLPLPLALAGIGLAIGASTYIIARARGRGPSIPIAIGLIASTLVSPYVNFYDVSALVLAAWLLLAADPPQWLRIGTMALYIPLYLAPIAPVVTLLALMAWLISLALWLRFERSIKVAAVNPGRVDMTRPGSAAA